MKAQACKFRRAGCQTWEDGIAILDTFDLSSVKTIVDSDGDQVPDDEGFDYQLKTGPLAYLDASYKG